MSVFNPFDQPELADDGAARGTSNSNERGSSAQRRKRKQWVLETYRADRDLEAGYEEQFPQYLVTLGKGTPACRCFRCGTLLTLETLVVNRIVPADDGGTFNRMNIRPACQECSDLVGKEQARARAEREGRGS